MVFINQTSIKMAKFNEFSIDGHDGGLLCHFIDSPCMFSALVAKKKQR